MEYDDDMLREINDNADLLAYAQQTMELEQRGNDYFAHCPLHQDKTPSLSFTPAKNSYYCFSCGRSGGMIGFLIDFEGLDFDSAVEKASVLANVDMSKMCQSRTISMLKRWRTALMPKIEVVKHEIIPKKELEKFSKTEKATEWISEGIKPDVLDLFGIRIDTYGNRIVYPVYDIDGNLINIKGRTRYANYKALKLAKYMNYYKVGIMDYFQGLEITLPYIKEKNEIIIFESIKSVMKAYGWGYKNCASAEKHTLTPEQISLLAKLKVDVVLAYDSDIDYKQGEVWEDIERLRRITNVYIIEDKDGLLGGKDAKNSPADCGLDIWNELYLNKRKVV